MERSAMDGVYVGATSSPGSLWPRRLEPWCWSPSPLLGGRRSPNTCALLPATPATARPLAAPGAVAFDPDPRCAGGATAPRGHLPGRGELPHPHRGNGGQWPLVGDPGADQPREQDGDEQSPAGGEEAETDAQLTLKAENNQKRHHPDTPRHVPCAPRERRLGGAEPDRVYSVNIVISADPQRRVTPRSAGEQAGDPRPEVHPCAGHCQ